MKKQELKTIGEERCLWLAVIAQALDDLVSPPTEDDPNRQYDAYRWFFHGKEAFKTVCDFAGVHADEIRARAKTIMAELKINIKGVITHG